VGFVKRTCRECGKKETPKNPVNRNTDICLRCYKKRDAEYKKREKELEKILISGVDEEIENLKSAYNRGIWSREEYNLRKAKLMEKKKQIKAGNHD
jgi:hypothetical protein